MDLNALEFQQQMQEILQLQEMSSFSMPLSMPQDELGMQGVSLPVEGMHMPMSMSVGHAEMGMGMGAMGMGDMHAHMQTPMQIQMQMPMHLSHTHTHAHTLNGMPHTSLSHAHMSSLPMAHMHMSMLPHTHIQTHTHAQMHAYSSSQPAVDKHRKVLAVAKKRKAITPYIRFCSEQRPYLKEKYPDATFIELGKMFGRMWNQLTDEQKAKYNTPTAQELAEEQDLEDTADHAAASSSSKKGKNKRKTVTPYIRFCAEQRPFLKQKYPDATFVELGKMFGRIWNQLTDLQKAKYAVAQPGEHGYVEEDEEGADGNAEKPKRQKTITPYIRFCSEQRPFLKQKYPDMAFTDMGKMFGRMWNQLTDEQKAAYAIPREEY